MSEPPSETLVTRVSKWLVSQGYPLEMATARAFRELGFWTRQSEYYADPETSIAREIDVVAHKQEQVGSVLLRVTVCMECKVSRDKPWVLFTSEDVRLAGPARVAQRAASELGRKFLAFLADSPEVQCLEGFSLPPRPGYGITQAFTSGHDDPYVAVTAAAKCAAALADAADRANELQGPQCEIIMPAVVVDGRLFECFLDADDRLTVSEAEAGTLVWRNPIAQHPHTIVRIATLGHLPALAREADAVASALFSREADMSYVVSKVASKGWASERTPSRWRRRGP